MIERVAVEHDDPNFLQPIDRVSQCAAFIWYSGNTSTNTTGSLMLYLSGSDAYACYASFEKQDCWRVADECRITRPELVAFEESGRQLETARMQ
jgi:hypothetical protein